ncbi:ATP-binding cassette sub-family C member 4-like [Bolinopsis microptera]|uniref:ATP-binding cassette sub-family C member 4-like n=1 Tax=Bolinopsis microptera TaxID=2820187 RepID=UPI00307978AF
MVVNNGNPEVNAGIFRSITFWWVQKIFTTGNKRPLTEDDVFPIDPRLQSERLTALLEQQWLREAEKSKNPSLAITLLKRHWFTIMWLFVAFNFEAAFRCSIPFVVVRITSYFDPVVEMTQQTALLWSVCLLLMMFTMVGFRSYLYYSMMRLGTVLRVEVTGLVYRKACRITQREIGERSVGLILNLITNDAQRLDENITVANALFNMWSALGIAFATIYTELGIYSTLAAFVPVLLCVPIQLGIGRIVLYLREKASVLTDRRVKIIHEIILFMKVIKMYGWELMFKKLVGKIRRKESKVIGLFVLTQTMNSVIFYVIPVVALLLSISIKMYVDEPMKTSEIFFFLSLINVLEIYINIFLGNSFSYFSQLITTFRRIQDFLNADEIKHIYKKAAIMNLTNEVIINKSFLHKEPELRENHGLKVLQTGVKTESIEMAVTLDNFSSKWGPDVFSLNGLNLTVKKGELIAVVGPVACGKTTLLMSILQELEHEGILNIDGSVGFSSQVPWIFNGNIEENILFNRPLDKEKLNKCIESCYLTKDIEQFSNGLYTVVGERGTQLSGGQKARVNLARAVYAQDPIILLDDPLSAVDSRCAKHIFNKLIKDQLAGKTRILVTHATHFLSEVDRIVVMDTEVVTDGNKTKVVGKISHVGTYSELLSKGLTLSIFGSGENKRRRNRTTSKLSCGPDDVESDEYSETDETKKPAKYEEEKKTGTLSKMLYIKYSTLSIGYIAIPILLVALVAPQILSIYQQQYAIEWLNHRHEIGINFTEEERDQFDKSQYQTYVGLAIGTAFLFIGRALVYLSLIYRSGKKLHNDALFAILRSPMRFFDTNPIGMIINRFTKDTYFMDERYSFVSLDFLSLFLLFSASLALAVIANFWFIIPLVLLVTALLLTVRYYLRTSVELRRIEALKRSPILSHISATLSGLTTIRANNQIEIFESKHYHARDEHTRCWILFQAASHWYSLRLDCLTVLTSVIATFLTVLLKEVVGASVAGLAVVYITNMVSGFQWCIRQYTETENMMTAVERIYMFADLPSEAPLEVTDKKTMVVSNKVATSGVIEFRNVRLKYDPEGDYILRDLSFLTKPCEKIGIVGRTGAGKSTILQALFRMVEPEGEILLDGMLTREMGLHELRRSISIIPQESLLFSETLRVNLDPFFEFSDDYLWDALEKVELKSYVSAQTGGLEMMVQEGGGNLSAGQRQLLCLARALLKDNKFLVIDEATANVDERTDQLIQQTLRQEFSKCTVLTIAHRINTIIDSDRIMVIDEGKLAEFDHPALLLNRPESIFYDLVNETGMFEVLLDQANMSFDTSLKSE